MLVPRRTSSVWGQHHSVSIRTSTISLPPRTGLHTRAAWSGKVTQEPRHSIRRWKSSRRRDGIRRLAPPRSSNFCRLCSVYIRRQKKLPHPRRMIRILAGTKRTKWASKSRLDTSTLFCSIHALSDTHLSNTVSTQL